MRLNSADVYPAEPYCPPLCGENEVEVGHSGALRHQRQSGGSGALTSGGFSNGFSGVRGKHAAGFQTNSSELPDLWLPFTPTPITLELGQAHPEKLNSPLVAFQSKVYIPTLNHFWRNKLF